MPANPLEIQKSLIYTKSPAGATVGADPRVIVGRTSRMPSNGAGTSTAPDRPQARSSACSSGTGPLSTRMPATTAVAIPPSGVRTATAAKHRSTPSSASTAARRSSGWRRSFSAACSAIRSRGSGCASRVALLSLMSARSSSVILLRGTIANQPGGTGAGFNPAATRRARTSEASTRSPRSRRGSPSPQRCST